jgi:hypothetical protein
MPRIRNVLSQCGLRFCVEAKPVIWISKRSGLHVHNSADHPGLTSRRRLADMALQHRLGLLPKWRPRLGSCHRAGLGLDGTRVAAQDPRRIDDDRATFRIQLNESTCVHLHGFRVVLVKRLQNLIDQGEQSFGVELLRCRRSRQFFALLSTVLALRLCGDD